MQTVELTWGRIIRIWWLYAWRGTLVGLLIGAVLGALIGIIASILALTVFDTRFDDPVYMQNVHYIVYGVCFPAGVLWGLYAFRMAMRKKYKGFRIILVSDEPAA